MMSRDLIPAQRKSDSLRNPNPKPADNIYTSRRLPLAFSKNGTQRGMLALPSPGKPTQKSLQRRSPPPSTPSISSDVDSHPLSRCQEIDKKEIFVDYFQKHSDPLCAADKREASGQTQSGYLKPVNDHHFDVPVKTTINSEDCAASEVGTIEMGGLTKDRKTERPRLCKMAAALRSGNSRVVAYMLEGVRQEAIESCSPEEAFVLEKALAALGREIVTDMYLPSKLRQGLAAAMVMALVVLSLLMLLTIGQLASFGSEYSGLVPT